MSIDRIFTIRPDGRDGVLYQEGDRKMTISTEMCIGEFQRAILADSISNWMPPFEDELITSEKKRAILHAIIDYWEAKGKRVNIENKEFWCTE